MADKIEGIVTAKGLRFALVISRFNDLIASKLKEGAIDCLTRHEAEEGVALIEQVVKSLI